MKLSKILTALAVSAAFSVSINAQEAGPFGPPPGGGGGDRGQQRGERGGPGGRRGGMRRMGGGMMGGMMRQIRECDKNGNLLIEEEEFSEAWKKQEEKTDKALALIVELCDEDKDGKLNEKESEQARQLVMGLMGTMRFDTNKNWKLEEDEKQGAWDQMTAGIQRYNQMMLERNDKNKDGEISAEEAKAAEEEMKKRRERWAGRRDNRGAPGEHGAPPPPDAAGE